VVQVAVGREERCSQVMVHLPGGMRVEGLDVAGIADLVRLLA